MRMGRRSGSVGDQETGRPAGFTIPPGAVLQFKIGDEISEGTGISVQRYRRYGGREVFRLELLNAVVIEGGNL